jgi:hypothetical protein
LNRLSLAERLLHNSNVWSFDTLSTTKYTFPQLSLSKTAVREDTNALKSSDSFAIGITTAKSDIIKIIQNDHDIVNIKLSGHKTVNSFFNKNRNIFKVKVKV